MLPEEETRDLCGQIQFARDTLVQNEKKIWFRIKKGREILSEFDTACACNKQSIHRICDKCFCINVNEILAKQKCDYRFYTVQVIIDFIGDLERMSEGRVLPLKIIVTACGCPGASTLIRMLKNNGERPIGIIGTDMSSKVVGRFLCDGFYEVPAGTSPDYLPVMMNIVKKEKPDLIFPESSNEVLSLARARDEFESIGTKVVVSSPEAIKTSSNKYLMYEAIRKGGNVDLPRYVTASTLDEFLHAVKKIGYPKEPVVFKPHIGKGSRGVRIIDPKADRKRQLMEEKPINKYMSLEEFIEIFQHVDDSEFPDFLVMEYLKGMEKTADTLAMNGRELLTTIKTVEKARWGVIVEGELVRDDYLVEQTRQILEDIPLSYCVNIQFIAGKLIEINPRVSTFIYQKNLIAPYLAIKLALNELNEDDITNYRNSIDYGRRMIRYMDQLFYKDGGEVL